MRLVNLVSYARTMKTVLGLDKNKISPQIAQKLVTCVEREA